MRPALIVALLLAPGIGRAQDLQSAPPGALSCSGCHGPVSAFPMDGWGADHIAEALIAYRDGALEGTIMPRLAAGLNDAEIAAIATWIAAQEESR